jgi:hypothetical protein
MNKEIDFGSKLRQRNLVDVKEAQKAFRELFAYGVTPDFKVKGFPPEVPKTVKGILALNDPTDQVMARQSITMYHGTSMKRWQIIQRQGLRPGNASDIYNDLVPGYSEFNIYVCTTAKNAEFYGKRQAKKDRDDAYVILQLQIPDPVKLRPDDRFSHGQTKPMSRSGRELGEFAYKGSILPQQIKLYKEVKYPGDHASFVKGDRVVGIKLGNRNMQGTVTQVYSNGALADIVTDEGKEYRHQEENRWRVVEPAVVGAPNQYKAAAE